MALSTAVFPANNGDSHIFPPYVTQALQDLRYDRYVTETYMLKKNNVLCKHKGLSNLHVSFLLSGLAFLEQGVICKTYGSYLAHSRQTSSGSFDLAFHSHPSPFSLFPSTSLLNQHPSQGPSNSEVLQFFLHSLLYLSDIGDVGGSGLFCRCVCLAASEMHPP